MKRTTVIRRSVAAGLVGLSAFTLAACGGKPSASDVNKKLTEVLVSNGAPKDKAQKLSDCMAPKLVEGVSEDGLKTMMDTKASEIKGNAVPNISKADEAAISKAAESCAGVLMGK